MSPRASIEVGGTRGEYCRPQTWRQPMHAKPGKDISTKYVVCICTSVDHTSTCARLQNIYSSALTSTKDKYSIPCVRLRVGPLRQPLPVGAEAKHVLLVDIRALSRRPQPSQLAEQEVLGPSEGLAPVLAILDVNHEIAGVQHVR